MKVISGITIYGNTKIMQISNYAKNPAALIGLTATVQYMYFNFTIIYPI